MKQSTERATWASRSTFILAAIGSAVGLGNAWRFPGLVAKHGGATFLFVYLIAMFVMGIPLFMMEISIGRKMRGGAPSALKGIHPKAEWIGWAATSNAFVIAIYYAVVFGWVLLMTFMSYKFAGMTGTETAVADASGLWGKTIETTGVFDGFSIISWPAAIALLIAWALIYYVRTIDEAGNFLSEVQVEKGYVSVGFTCVTGVAEGTLCDAGYKSYIEDMVEE